MSATCPQFGCADCCATIWTGWSLDVLEVKANRWRNFPDPRTDPVEFAKVARIMFGEGTVEAEQARAQSVAATLLDWERVPQIWTEVEEREGMYRYECSVFDPVLRTCTDHENRPAVCRSYPWYLKTELTRADLTSGRCTYVADDPTTVFLPLVAVNGVAV